VSVQPKVTAMTRRFPLLAVIALAALVLAVPAAQAEVGLVGAWGGPGTQPGQFSGASAVAVDNGSHVYVADTNNHRVQRFDADGRFERELGAGVLVAPTGVAADERGNVFVADTDAHRVVHFDHNGTVLHQWGDAATLPGPTGIAVDRAGSVFVTGAFGELRRYTPDGHLLASWGGGLLDPRSLAVAPDGSVYVADGTQLIVQPFAPSGQPLARLGGGFTGPAAVAFDRSTGHLLVADRPSGRVERRTTGGALVSAFGAAPDQPAGVAVDCHGTVFVADAGGERVQRYGVAGAPTGADCPPVASFDVAGDVRAGVEATLDATASWATVGRLVRWTWEIDGPGGKVTATREAPSFTYAFPSAGEHRVRLRVQDDDGDTGEVERTITVAGGPAARDATSGSDARPWLRIPAKRMSVTAFRRRGVRVAVGRAPASATSFTVTVRRAGRRGCVVLRRTLPVRGRAARRLHAGGAGIARRVRGGQRPRCAARPGRHLVSVSFGGGRSAPSPVALGLVRRRTG
jgi:sugar lactone lactonase YvrE